MVDSGGLFNPPQQINPLFVSTTGNGDRDKKIVTLFLTNDIGKSHFAVAIVFLSAADPHFIILQQLLFQAGMEKFPGKDGVISVTTTSSFYMGGMKVFLPPGPISVSRAPALSQHTNGRLSYGELIGEGTPSLTQNSHGWELNVGVQVQFFVPFVEITLTRL